MRAIVLVVGLALFWSACGDSKWRPSSEKVWTVAELKSLQGKTRDEVREILGPPTGLYTIDAKGRWHYPHMNVTDQESGEPWVATVKVYFSQLGEQRATIIEITKRQGDQE
ncbi:MAG: hypothetical protein H6Q32_1350 [Bacteroidetes bacterium]|nr:hypothetical protein [Bacteroidota bacterium]